jgi:hypothetical protein
VLTDGALEGKIAKTDEAARENVAIRKLEREWVRGPADEEPVVRGE